MLHSNPTTWTAFRWRSKREQKCAFELKHPRERCLSVVVSRVPKKMTSARAETEKYLRFLCLKSVQVIVEARLGQRVSTPSKPNSIGADWVSFRLLDHVVVLSIDINESCLVLLITLSNSIPRLVDCSFFNIFRHLNTCVIIVLPICIFQKPCLSKSCFKECFCSIILFHKNFWYKIFSTKKSSSIMKTLKSQFQDWFFFFCEYLICLDSRGTFQTFCSSVLRFFRERLVWKSRFSILVYSEALFELNERCFVLPPLHDVSFFFLLRFCSST